MPKYITLFTYTGAIEGGGPQRFKQAQQIVADVGGEIVHVFGVLGPYDIVGLVECPDNQAAMKAAAAIGNLIGAKTVTMPAVERDDFLQLLSEL